MTLGMPLLYHPDRWPELEPGHGLSESAVEGLDAEKLLCGRFVEEMFAQMDQIEAGWGAIHGYLNWQGVLNNAFHARGQQIFLDLADAPELGERLFEILTQVMIGLAQAVQRRQRRSGFHIDELCVSNCTMSMVSPGMYRRFLLPCDRRIAESFERFGVHTCNWDATPYLAELRKLPNLGYLDMGLASDLAAAKEQFPEARRAVLYSPRRVVEQSLEQIRLDMERVQRELAPCDVVLADLPLGVPDERVNDVLRICRELEQSDVQR